MTTSGTRHMQTGRRFAALLAAFAVAFCAVLAVWHFDHEYTAEAALPSAVITAALNADAEVPAPLKAVDQDCAFHCDQHGRGLPSVAAVGAEALPRAPKLLTLHDSASDLAQPDGLIEPPRT
jgi:hypothetical protein